MPNKAKKIIASGLKDHRLLTLYDKFTSKFILVYLTL